MPKTTYVIDGYNVINAWPELIALKEDSLEHARDKLLEIMAGFGAYKGSQIVVVFDAHGVTGPNTCEEFLAGIDVIYTNEGQTADSYIEKMVYYLVRQGVCVYVVTSDWAEQMVILGAGAYRISAREMLRDVQEMRKKIKEGFAETVVSYRRQELGNRLSKDVLHRLDELRRGR